MYGPHGHRGRTHASRNILSFDLYTIYMLYAVRVFRMFSAVRHWSCDYTVVGELFGLRGDRVWRYCKGVLIPLGFRSYLVKVIIITICFFAVNVSELFSENGWDIYLQLYWKWNFFNEYLEQYCGCLATIFEKTKRLKIMRYFNRAFLLVQVENFTPGYNWKIANSIWLDKLLYYIIQLKLDFLFGIV